MIIYVMVNMVRYGMGIVWFMIQYNIQYGMVDKFCKFVKIKLIHQLNHNNFFEHLNHTTKLSQNCLNQTGGGVHAGSKEKNVVGVLGGGGGGGAVLAVWLVINLQNLSKIEFLEKCSWQMSSEGKMFLHFCWCQHLNHKLKIFEQLNHNNDKFMSKRPHEGPGVVGGRGGWGWGFT